MLKTIVRKTIVLKVTQSTRLIELGEGVLEEDLGAVHNARDCRNDND